MHENTAATVRPDPTDPAALANALALLPAIAEAGAVLRENFVMRVPAEADARVRLASLCVSATTTKAAAMAMVLAAAPGVPWTPSQLGRLTGLKGSTAGVNIKRMVRDGRALSLGGGKYAGKS